MYEFYYHKLKPYYNNTQSTQSTFGASGIIKLLYMDTDSFILSIKAKEVLKDLDYFKNDFDFSESDENHPLYDITIGKVIGKMKIETSPIIELDNFVALRSKSYA